MGSKPRHARNSNIRRSSRGKRPDNSRSDNQYRNSKGLPRELVQLMEKQIERLEKETFGGLTDAERREYEERQDCINDLCEKLRYLHPAA